MCHFYGIQNQTSVTKKEIFHNDIKTEESHIIEVIKDFEKLKIQLEMSKLQFEREKERNRHEEKMLELKNASILVHPKDSNT